jgi:diaminopimelate decarboxylase
MSQFEAFMQGFHYQNNQLYVEKIPVAEIGEKYGTPVYIYSRQVIEKNWHAFDDGFGNIPHRICYAVKANSNLAILNVLARLNSGFDIVSIGELERVLAAGGDPKRTIFSGVGKTVAEIERAMAIGIFCFNVESDVETERLEAVAARLNKTVNIALRVNPDIDANTHPYISTGLKENKFGIEIPQALALCAQIKKMPHLQLTGIACHIGSQLTEVTPILEAVDKVLALIAELRTQGQEIEHLDIGGGLGVCYQHEKPPTIAAYVQALLTHLKDCPYEIVLEPGRAIIAEAGILLTRVEYLKHTSHKNFAIIDAAMNDLMRPALYNAWQKIMTVKQNQHAQEKLYDIVGPVCESADFLGRDRTLAIEPQDLLAIGSAGAYGFAMSSNYNTRARAAEVIVDGDKVTLIRRRETIAELFAGECTLDS